MIKDISISSVLNSRREKTIKVSIKTDKGIYKASSPSGKSIGKWEAKTRNIKSILKNFPKIKKNFIKKDEREVDKIIERMGINKIGANLSIALSMASLRAISKNKIYKFLNPSPKYFPYPLGNVIGGGAHRGYTSEQEFLVIPRKAKTMNEAIKTNYLIWKEVGRVLKSKKVSIGKNDEGAWMCKLNDIKTLDILSDVAEDYGTKVGIDFAAYQIYKNGIYFYLHPKRKFSSEEQLDFVKDLIKTYKIFYVEDPFHQSDFKNFSELTRKVKCLICSDDLIGTQPSRLKIGIKKKAGNSVIIKPDQAGTVSKTLKTIKIAKKSKFTTIVSHRSGETLDSFISDLAVGTDSPLIKCGIYGKERISKLNRLLKIWNSVKNPRMSKLKTFI